MLYKVKQYLDALAYPYYRLAGRIPWTPGYVTAKRRGIEYAIRNNLLSPNKLLPVGYGFRIDERIIEYPWVYTRMEIPRGGKVLDAGSVLNYDFLLKFKPVSEARLTICTLAPEKRCYWKSGISYVYDDLRATMFRSEYFDCVVSISTIEHIGLDNTMLYTDDAAKREMDQSGYIAAVREFRRIIKPGGTCFITVPYGKAAVRKWFQVFDAAMIESVLKAFEPRTSVLEYFAYDADGWRRAEAKELENSTCHDIHQDGKPFGDMAAGARGVVCMLLRT